MDTEKLKKATQLTNDITDLGTFIEFIKPENKIINNDFLKFVNVFVNKQNNIKISLLAISTFNASHKPQTICVPECFISDLYGLSLKRLETLKKEYELLWRE